MDTSDIPERISMLERMADQQLRLNDQLIEVTARLTHEQGLHAERLARYEEIMASMAQTLAAIKDMLNRPNGR